MEPWDTDPLEEQNDPMEHEQPADELQDYYQKADEIARSLHRARMSYDLFGESSGRGILGDSIADWQLAQDLASGMDIREALSLQRGVDYLVGDRRSSGIIGDALTDDLIARDIENGMDIGEAVVKNESWANFFDDLLDN